MGREGVKKRWKRRSGPKFRLGGRGSKYVMSKRTVKQVIFKRHLIIVKILQDYRHSNSTSRGGVKTYPRK